MKKLLALVLALVMTLSLATVGANAAFEDEKISEDYAEAVAVLNGMGVFQGDDNGKFNPTKSITRAEVATILYRIATADTAKHGSNKAGLYASYNKFSDGNHWAAGYIGYCANAELVKGYPDGTYKPEGNVTGYEVLAMILRAVGYDKNGEFSGADWALNVAKVAQQLGMLENVDKTTDLGAAATRELVAELLFQGIQAKIVTYTPAFGYVTDKVMDKTQTSLGAKFELECDDDTQDIWGRPTITWTYNCGDKETVIAVEADAAYHVATSQCDICADLGEKKSATVVDTYTNGVLSTKDATLTATATKAMVGEQGQQVEFYSVDGGYRMVVVDTYLAKVVDVVIEKADAKGHVIRDDYMELSVYMTSADPETIFVPGNDYEEGDYVLVNVNEVEKVSIIGVSGKQEYVDILGEAESFEGAQTKIWKNSSKHTIDSKDYDDAYRFYLDEAGVTGTVKYTWFFDQFGNLIGDVAIDSLTNYAVLKDMIWIVGRPGYAEATIVFMDGSEETVIVNNIDAFLEDLEDEEQSSAAWGEEGLVPELADSNGDVGFNDVAEVSSDSRYNDVYEGVALYKVCYNADGTVDLVQDSIVYESAVTIDKGASTVLDTNSGDKLDLNDKTQFLAREKDEKGNFVYEDYDRNTLPQYASASLDIFYTVGSNGFVNRLYIKNAANESDFGTYLFVTTDAYGRVAGEYNTYEMNVLVDGVERTICTNAANVEYLAANVGKLFLVSWEGDHTEGYYGFVDEAILINEAWDDDEWDKGDCDYVTGDAKLDGNTLVADELNWTITADTEVIGADSVADIDFAEDGVWVIAAEGRYATAATIYVGTKLDESVALTVTAKAADGSMEYSQHGKLAWIFTSKEDVESATLTLTANDANSVIEIDETAVKGSTTVTFTKADAEKPSLVVEVYNEAGTNSAAYSLVQNWTESPAPTSAKANVEVKVDSTVISAAETTVYTTVAEAMKNANKVSLASVNDATVSVTSNDGDWSNVAVYGSASAASSSAISGNDTENTTASVSNANVQNGTYIVVTVSRNFANWYVVYYV